MSTGVGDYSLPPDLRVPPPPGGGTQPPGRRRLNYLNVSYGVKSWLLTIDHKRIALLYLASVTVMFFIGGSFATLIRLELITPQGDLVDSETSTSCSPCTA
jgi:cytochrome c oxidase subunit 1